MGKVKIQMPEKYIFTTEIPIRIADVNYGGHVGNDAILSIIHEARMQYLRQFGYTELKCGGVSLIMSDVAIEYKYELFYGDVLIVSLATDAISRVAFDVYYLIEKKSEGEAPLVANARTGMVCFNYDTKKVVSMTPEFKSNLFPDLQT